MIEHAWIAPKGFVRLTKIYVLWYCCEYAHLISSRTPLKLLLAVGLPLWLLVFLNENSEEQQATWLFFRTPSGRRPRISAEDGDLDG